MVKQYWQTLQCCVSHLLINVVKYLKNAYLSTKFTYTWHGQVVTNTTEISFQECKNVNINLSVTFNITSQCMCLEKKNPSAMCVFQWLKKLWATMTNMNCVPLHPKVSWHQNSIKVGEFRSPPKSSFPLSPGTQHCLGNVTVVLC